MPKPNTVEGFWRLVEKTETCWIWHGFVNSHGYGKFGFQGKKWFAHRLAYKLTYGEIPDNLCACHSCDNPLCVRPDHLFLGTKMDNWNDMRAKHRQGRIPSAQCHLARLTDDKVRQMIAEYQTGTVTQAELARRFLVDKATVNHIIRGRTWKHITLAFREAKEAGHA